MGARYSVQSLSPDPDRELRPRVDILCVIEQHVSLFSLVSKEVLQAFMTPMIVGILAPVNVYCLVSTYIYIYPNIYHTSIDLQKRNRNKSKKNAFTTQPYDSYIKSRSENDGLSGCQHAAAAVHSSCMV